MATGAALFAIHARTDRVSIDSSGASGNGASTEAAINSDDGRFIGFASLATNLTALPGASGSQIYIHDRQTGLPSLVSRVNLGNGGNGAGNQPTISADGRYVAFTSAATNLAAIVGGSGSQIFLRDTQPNQTILVSRDMAGNAGNGASSQPAISTTSGQFIAFASLATNLASIAGGSGSQVFIRDTQENQTSLVSKDNSAPANAGAGASAAPAIVGNGEFVAFSSLASNFLAGGVAPPDVYVRTLP